METGLQLLMRDGTLHLLFRPKLTAEQYDQLLRAVVKPDTKRELQAVALVLAKRWGIEVQVD